MRLPACAAAWALMRAEGLPPGWTCAVDVPGGTLTVAERVDGEVLLGDEFSADGCRLWDAETREKLDKDRFRQGLGGVVEAYQAVARRLGVPLEG